MTRGREETRIVPDSYVKLIYPRFYAFVYGKSEKKNEHVIWATGDYLQARLLMDYFRNSNHTYLVVGTGIKPGLRSYSGGFISL